MVSGFLITSLLLEERARNGVVDLRHFWVRRGRRLLPALYLLLAVTSAATLLVYHDAAGRMGGDVLAAIAYVYNWWQIFLDQSYFAQAGRPPLLQHLWSLAVEEQFYLIFPPIFALCLVKFGHLRGALGRGRHRPRVGGADGTALQGGRGHQLHLLRHLHPAVGAAAGGVPGDGVDAVAVAPSWRRRRPGPCSTWWASVGLVLIAWFMLRVNAFDPFIYRGGFLLLDIVCITVIAVLVHPAARLSKVLSWAPLVWVGLRSYSLYLWHWPIFMVTRPEPRRAAHGLSRCSCSAWCSPSARPSCRTATSRHRCARVRWVAGTATCAPATVSAARRWPGGAWPWRATFSVLVLLIGVGLYRSATSPDREAIELAAMGDATGRADRRADRGPGRRSLRAGDHRPDDHDHDHHDAPRPPSPGPRRPPPVHRRPPTARAGGPDRRPRGGRLGHARGAVGADHRDARHPRRRQGRTSVQLGAATSSAGTPPRA